MSIGPLPLFPDSSGASALENLFVEYDRLKSMQLDVSSDARADKTVVQQIARLTEEIFRAPVSIEVEHDPDNPREPWLLFVVSSTADIPTIMQLEREWHERTAQIVPDDPLGYRLGVHPLE